MYSSSKTFNKTIYPFNSTSSYTSNQSIKTYQPSQDTREDYNYNDKFFKWKKYPQVSKSSLNKTQSYAQTSKSLIVSHKQHRYCQQYDKVKNNMTNSGKVASFKQTNINKNQPPQLTKIYSQQTVENNHFDKFLQMAKKQKQRFIPSYSLMFTQKSYKFTQKPQPFAIQELRQTQDTLTDNQQFFKFSSPKASDFHQVKLLGKGKNGQVYLAIHKATGFACAMKIIKKADINKGTASERQILKNQLLRQIKVQLFMSNPNLIELYAVFSDKDNIYLIQELGIDGQLYDMMKKKFRFSQESTALLSRQILKGIKALHEKNIIHRDIKPENIVLIYGTAKVCDFGWSVHCPLELRSTLCGTPLYLSPQVLIGDEYNQKIDIWAFGTLVYQLFTGDNPFQIKHRGQLQKIVTQQLDFAKNFPRRLKGFLQSILKKRFTQRPTAKQLQNHEFLKKYAELQTSQQLAYT